MLVAAELEHRGVGTNWLAAVAAARLAPYLLCSPVAGALAGRYEARTVFAVTGLARGVLIAALWIASEHGDSDAGTGVAPLRSRRSRHTDVPRADAGRSPASAPRTSRSHECARRGNRICRVRCRTRARRAPAHGRHHGLAARVRGNHGGVGGGRRVRPPRRGRRPTDRRTIESTPSRHGPMPARCRAPTGDRGRGGSERPRRADGHAARATSGRARLGRRTRLRTALVRFRRRCVRRVRRAPPPRPAWASIRPADHRWCGSRRARRDRRAVRGIAGVLLCSAPRSSPPRYS